MVFKRLLLVGVLVALMIPVQGFAEIISQRMDHSLNFGQESASWEHRIDLPEALVAQGFVFNGRTLNLQDKLVIEREELARTYYYVRVRLVKSRFSHAQGSLQVTLDAGLPIAPLPLPLPSGLAFAGQPLEPWFSWSGTGTVFALSLFDRMNNRTIWERVVPGNFSYPLDEGSLKAGGRYLLAISQSNASARYSGAVQKGFRIDQKPEFCKPCRGSGKEICMNCNGTGMVSTGGYPAPIPTPCNICMGTGRVPCRSCNGTGKVMVPFLVDEGYVSLSAEKE